MDPPPYPKQEGGNAGGFVQPPAYPPQQGYPPPQQQAPYGYGAPQPPPAASYGQPMDLAGGYDSDAEGQAGGLGSGFGDKAIRRGFIRKVYGILMCQLLLTGAIIACFVYVEDLRQHVRRSNTIYWISFVIMIVCLIGMACCEGVRRKFPTNILFLAVFTGAQGFMLGSMCARFEADAIFIAVGITAGVTLGLTIFAFQTKIDFTTCGGMLCAMMMILFLAGIGLAIFGTSKWTMIAYGSAGALIFSLYIVYDTQLMMGGKHKYALDPEEYIFAALNIYLDIVNLFMYILMIVGASSSD